MAENQMTHLDTADEQQEQQGHKHTVNSTIEDLGTCKKLIKVSVPPDEVKKEVEEQLVDLRRNVKVKGFRQGKVPQDMIRKQWGESVRQNVKKHLLEHAYFQALKDRDVKADRLLGDSRVENLKFSEEEGLSFDVTILLRPTFELPEYKHIHIELPKLKVTDEDVEKALEGFRRARGEIQPMEDPNSVVEAEDFLTCDVEVWLADEWESKQDAAKKPEGEQPAALKPLKEMKDQEVHVPVDRVGELDVEDLQDSLMGVKIGEWGEVETDLPQDFEVVEGRGEPAIVRLKINAIKRLVLPPLTEEWAKESGYDSIEALRREAREDIFRRKELARISDIEGRILDKLSEKVGAFDMPPDLIDAELQDQRRRRELELRYEGKTEQEAKNVVDEEEEELKVRTVQNLRHFFILDEVAKKERIRVSDADVDARIARIAQGSGKPLAEVRRHFEERKVIPQLRHELLAEKTRAFLRENAKIVDQQD